MASTTNLLLGIALFISSASAHITLANPVPYGEPQLDPLSATGANYPCQIPQGGAYTVKQMNDWPVGSQQTLSFKGSAVHGGGSCQLSVTTDKTPTKDSKFKVIYSIEGGCPGVSGGGSTFPFTVPKELPDGELTVAWTWINKIGNREFYMNCAPIKVSGGSDNTAAFDALPDMAIANIAVGEGANCKAAESKDYTFKNPGKYTTRIGSGPFVELCGGEASPGQGNQDPPPAASGAPPAQSGGSNNGLYTPPASQAPAPTPSAPASSVVVSQPAQQPAASSGLPSSQADAVTSTIRTFITVTAPIGTAPTAQPSVAPPNPSQAPANSGVPVAQPSQAPGAPEKGTCTTDGAIVCNGADKFGICNHGTAIWQSVAPGTQCKNSAITKRGYSHRAHRAHGIRS